MHADDWAIHNENRLLKRQESEAIRRDTMAFLKSGGKIKKIKSGITGNPEFKSAVYTDNVIENAKKANSARGGKFTKRHGEILAAIRKVMNGEKQILYATLRRLLRHITTNLRAMLEALSRKGFLDFDGTTITARMV